MMMMWDIGRGRTEPYIYIYIYIYHMYMLLANFSVEALRTGEVCMVQAV